MENNSYNPDVLNCLANLSNDEVFTPPTLANQMIDLLPQELFSDPKATFLDPFCKSGVFLREIVKRLDRGLQNVIPDRRERIDHIMHKQVFGIAITELTSLLSRRSLYCSKHADGEHSVSHFDTPEGNLRYTPLRHTWERGKCRYCGASQEVYDRGEASEQYAYQFIHTDNPERIFNMKFDVIIGNPPYQLSDGGNNASAKPIYHFFVEQAKKLNPRYLAMIIPSRWFAGGKGLEEFREVTLKDDKIKVLRYYSDARECFPGTVIGGGVCYFLWDKDYHGDCTYTIFYNGKGVTKPRKLSEFPIFIRFNTAIDIIHKLNLGQCQNMSELVSARNPYGLATSITGSSKNHGGCYRLYSSSGVSYIAQELVSLGNDNIDGYKVMVGRAISGHAGETDEHGQVKVLSTLKVIEPLSVCTDTYIIIPAKSENEAQNIESYLRTCFVRFLILQTVTSINITRNNYQFVPIQDFSHPWTDEMLYKKYNLSEEEIAFIESMIRPME